MTNVLNLNQVSLKNIAQVGGKNAGLGEMIQHLSSAKVLVPGGFATTAEAFRVFLKQNDLDKTIYDLVSQIDENDITNLQKTGQTIRNKILAQALQKELIDDIKDFYSKMGDDVTVAVRSSATAEDLPTASFAGQQQTVLNVTGIENVLSSIKIVFSSLFTDRAIIYRKQNHFPDNKVAMSVGIQKMVRSEDSVSGVIFTLDTESGFDQVVLINATYGLGEGIVSGKINPDEFCIYKPSLLAGKKAILKKQLGSKQFKQISGNQLAELRSEPIAESMQNQFCISDAEIEFLAQNAIKIESHDGKPMDIEWAKDSVDGKIYFVQARPETVQSQMTRTIQYQLQDTPSSEIIIKGKSVGNSIGQGLARIIASPSKMKDLIPGEVLVADMTDPDWEPVMRQASAIITNRGGRTCHAAIVARELGIPAVVGCETATQLIHTGDPVTVSCAQGDIGYVYRGAIPYKATELELKDIPKLPVNICMNLGNPERAFEFRKIPNDGVGLARLEFIISQNISVHPKACLEFDHLADDLRQEIKKATAAYATPTEYYVSKLTEGLATIAAAFSPKMVIMRFSDFKSNEYANLLGGNLYEPREENPMLGFRGTSRYISDRFKDCFTLECEAVKRVRNEMGLINLQIMLPFVRTVDEAQAGIKILSDNGLVRGEEDLKIFMMCEVPSNVILAEEFLEHFDGFSIGSNDLTQLTLGIDRDSELLSEEFDEQNDAVKNSLAKVIQLCIAKNKYIGICGQGPSDHPEFAQWLIKEGIGSLSLTPDAVIPTILKLSSDSSQ